MEIKIDDLTGPEVQALLREHLRNSTAHSPPESIHALDLEALRGPDITFWTVWEGNELVACGALKHLDERHAEIKSMHTRKQYRRRGFGEYLLRHILEYANEQAYRQISLETGSMQGFAPAQRLYTRFGFQPCEPFANYRPDPNSIFMSKYL